MKTTLIVSLLIPMAGSGLCRGQTSGNIVYTETGGKATAVQRERAQRVLTKDEVPPTPTSMFVEAKVLLNVKADEYVAVFGITHEGETLADCAKKMDTAVKAFVAELKSLGISGDDVAVDFITQNRIYGFEVQGDFLQEKLVGFELKKNVSIHYKDASQLEKLTLAAAEAQVFDLIKVDYIVKDLNRVQDKLMEEAARITKHKIARYEKLLGIKLQAPAQVYAEKTAIHYPTQLYGSYTAQGSEQAPGLDRERKFTVRSVRKTQTFFFNSLDGDGFDVVINPVITEPVVQCTLYLKVKYNVLQALVDSHFVAQEWIVRADARHAKSKTYKRSEVFAGLINR